MVVKTFILSDGTKLVYEDNGEGCPVLFIPGNCATRKTFTKYVDIFLKEGYRTISLDYRGVGDSIPSMTHPVTMELLGKDIAELIEGLDLNELVLIGHSMGANVIMEYIRDNGCDRLQAAILMDGSCKTYTKEGDGWEYANWCGQFTYEQALELIKVAEQNFTGALRMIVASMMPDASDEIVDVFLQKLLGDVEIQSMAELYPTVFHGDLRDALSKFTVPTAYIFADDPKSIVHYKITDFYESQVKGAYKSLGFKTADHTFIETMPEIVSEAIVNFLKNTQHS